MANDFKVSIIIPFYNAREYVTQAVESALNQPETGEVILIEDGSPDGGIEICQFLAQKYSQVRLLSHPDGKNHGAAASRNLGIIHSNFPFIAFLDADDFYLPNRFLKTSEVFSQNEDAEGVYEAIGAIFQSDESAKLWARLPLLELTTITKIVPPERLFEEIIDCNIGTFSFDGFTAKRNIFSKIGLFNEKLDFFEDTELMFKFSANGLLYPGSIDKPIAVRRVHNNNRITYVLDDKRKSYALNYFLWKSLLDWGETNLSKKKQKLVSLRFVERLHKSDYFDDHQLKDYISSRKNMFKIALGNPKILLNYKFWRKVIPAKVLLGLQKG